MRKYLITLLVMTMSVLIGGCADKKTYDNYSEGLNENGFYVSLDSYQEEIPDFTELSFTTEEVLEWSVKSIHDENLSVDDYVYAYGEEFIGTLGLTNKDLVEEGDIVSASLDFYMNETQMEGFNTTNNYEVTSEGDSIIRSMLNHKVGDSYETEYTFPEEEAEFAGQTATVKIVINSISMSSPLETGIIEENLDVINTYLDGVTDKNSYLESLRPILAEVSLELFIQDYLLNTDLIEVPKEYIEYEDYRLKARLQQIGYTYDEYKKEANVTDEDIVNYCKMVARENIICMKKFQSLGMEITDEDVSKYYAEKEESIQEAQGRPYMKLNMMRDYALAAIAKEVSLIDEATGNVINTVEEMEKDITDNLTVESTEESTEIETAAKE